MGKPGTLDFNDTQIILDHVKDSNVIRRLCGQDAVIKHLKSELSIIVNAKDIHKQHRGNYNFIDGKAVLVNSPNSFNEKIEVTCRIACGGMYKLKERITGETVNILDHLELLLPKFQSIGLFTFQNGIQNSPDHFKNMGNKIIEKLPESPLCIGFYNESNGIICGIVNDLTRFSNEWHLHASSVMIIRQMLVSLSKILSSIKSHKVLCTHIAHSEAGLIAHEVLTTKNYCLFKQYVGMDNFLKDHVITLTYGAVAPIPNIVHLAINNYSKDDIVMYYAKQYLDKIPKPPHLEDEALMDMAQDIHVKSYSLKNESLESVYAQLKSNSVDLKRYISEYPHKSEKNGYTLTVIESRVPKEKQPFIEKDHAFDGDTYQTALRENINALREQFGIYDCR